MKKIISVLFLLSTTIQAETIDKGSLVDDMTFSVTLERGLETELQYGYFYATKPITDKLSTTYGATWNIDVPGNDVIDLSTQTVTLSYQINNNFSVYALNDFNDSFERSETWLGTTYTW